MSRRANNLKRMKEAKRCRKQARESAAQAEAGILGNGDRRGGGDMHSKNKGSVGGVTVVDKFTGEIREGGPELFEEMFTGLAKERETFLSSKNPCYLVGRVRQNEGAFGAAEVNRMVDATFECACQDSPDAWYPNQYALSLAHSTQEDAATDVGYFLSNFELGLRISGERAARHLGQGDWLKESRQLVSRLKDPVALDGLTSEDYRNITAHVAGHSRLVEAISWYERGTGTDPRNEGRETGQQMTPDASRDQAGKAQVRNVEDYANGKAYMKQIGICGSVLLSRGLRQECLDPVTEDSRDLRLWDILWMFKSRSVVGFQANGVTVYGVYGLHCGDRASPLAVESRDGLAHTIMLPDESTRLNMTVDQCRKVLMAKNGSMNPARLVEAAACYGIRCQFVCDVNETGGE